MVVESSLKEPFLNYSHTVGLCVMQDRGFMYPVDTLLAKDGKMHTVSRAYVAARDQLRVTVYNSDSEYFGVYGGFGDGLGQFKWPSCIAQDSQENIYISDEQLNRINVFSNDGTPIKHWGETGSDQGYLDGPSGIAFDSDDNLYVADHRNHRVQKFTKDGIFITCFGNDQSSSSLNMPWGLTVSSNEDVYVADWGNSQIKSYSSDGQLIACYGEPGSGDGQLRNPSGVAVDEDGYVYVTDWGNERLQVFDKDGSFVSKFRGEATISVWGQEYLDGNYEEAEPRSRSNLEPELDIFGGDPHEESAHTEKFFWAPTSVKLDNSRKIYITESNRHRVQIYDRA